MKAEFWEPSDEDYTTLARQWMHARNLIREEFGYTLDQSKRDLDFIQRVIDHRLIDFRDRAATDALGVALGRILATNEEGLDWWVVVDDYGRDLVIRYKHSSLQIGARDFLTKRLEQHEQVDVRELYEALVRTIEELKHEVD